MTSSIHNEQLYAMCVAHFNEPMIVGFDLVRCIGYGETAVDCYIICRKHGGQIFWCSCVGGYTFLNRLKGQGHVRSTGGEDWDDFTRLDSFLELNGSPREAVFKLLTWRHDDWEGTPPRQGRIKQ